MKEIVALILVIFVLVGSYSMIVFFMGGIVSGILYPKDAPMKHKCVMFISGNLWFFTILAFIFFS